MVAELSNNDKAMLKAMLTDSGREWDIQQLLDLTGWNDQVHVAGSGKSLSESGLVTVTENHIKLISLDSEGKKALESGLLEERIWNWYLDSEIEGRTMQNLFKCGFDRDEAGPGIGLLKSIGVSLDSGKLVSNDEDRISSIISKGWNYFINLI